MSCPRRCERPGGVSRAPPAQALRALVILAGLCLGAAARAQAPAPTGSGGAADQGLQEVTISVKRLELLGTAATASEGVVSEQEIQLMPALRPAQLLESVPGLIVTSHSGEGKANQYLLRGLNLDHGTDLAVFVDGMPINQPTHAHGQGYTDLSFLIPELTEQMSYTKGPYYAQVGDFGAVGSVHISYRDTIADQLAAGAGTLGFRRAFASGSIGAGSGVLLAAAEAQHYDGPFATPDDARKENAVLRYSSGSAREGYSVTAMYYHQLWTNTTDVPLRAISEGLLPDRFGTLDPTDGGRAQRASLSLQAQHDFGTGHLSASAYFIYNELHLYNDFTHYLFDPVHGDQEDQFENRHVLGAHAGYTLPLPLGRFDNDLELGALTRHDWLELGRLPSVARAPLPATDDDPSFSNHDQVHLNSYAAYLQATTHWTPTVRTVLGVRGDLQQGTDWDLLAPLHQSAGYTNGGTARQFLAQPKASLIYTPLDMLELYASMGRGFHSADLRGVNQAVNSDSALPPTPLLAKQEGQELGLRAEWGPRLTLTLAVYNLWEQSETVLDADVGQDAAGPPSRRYGAELNITYQMTPFLEIYASYSGNHTRFTHPLDDGTGHVGTYISQAPDGTGLLALYLTHLGRWSGGLEYRYLGNYPLSAGPCVDAAAVRDLPGATSCANAPTAQAQVQGHGFGEVNLDANYAFGARAKLSLGIYNLLNTHANAAEFWYVDRLRSEIAAFPDGRADIHAHPLEPLTARLTVSVALEP